MDAVEDQECYSIVFNDKLLAFPCMKNSQDAGTSAIVDSIIVHEKDLQQVEWLNKLAGSLYDGQKHIAYCRGSLAIPHHCRIPKCALKNMMSTSVW